jgi:type IX secretion system substrate protein
MKKFLILALAAFSANLSAQSMQLRHVENGNLVLGPNANIYESTAANHNTHLNIDVTNMSSTAKSYNVKRYDAILNPNASAYFCFGGSCYTDQTMVSPSPLPLNAGESASTYTTAYMMLTADLDEGPMVGISKVKYTFFNTADITDSMQITINYNITAPVGIKETAKSLSSFELFPNPAKESTTIRINSPKAMESTLMLFNSIGEVVYKKDVFVSEGKNKIDLNLENLPAGVYFASLKTGDSSISKKLIIN